MNFSVSILWDVNINSKMSQISFSFSHKFLFLLECIESNFFPIFIMSLLIKSNEIIGFDPNVLLLIALTGSYDKVGASKSQIKIVIVWIS